MSSYLKKLKKGEMGEVGIRERVGSRKAEKKKGRRIAMSLTSEFQASLGYRTKPCHMP